MNTKSTFPTLFFVVGASFDATEFHVYSVESDETGIRRFDQGNLYHIMNTTNGINDSSAVHHSYFLILSMAIGANWCGFAANASALPRLWRFC